MTKGHTISVLDHGFVRYIDHAGSDHFICEAARVSYANKKEKTAADDEKLIARLYRDKHTSPFEMCKVYFNIKMPIFVMRQYVRHRMQNLNEVSARYTQLPKEFYLPNEWREQDVKNKQGSVPVVGFDPYLHTDHPARASVVVATFCENAYMLYEQLLAAGIAREMARMVLPVNIYTEIYSCWDLKNLLHFVTLREDAHAQAEIQDYGRAIKLILNELFPMTMRCYEKYKFTCVEVS